MKSSNSVCLKTTGNHVEILETGDVAYPEMLEAIRTAKKRVWLETYIFDDSEVADLFIQAACSAAKRNIDTVFILDDFGSMKMSAENVNSLEQAGGHVIFFNPIGGRKPSKDSASIINASPTIRDHRKILITDDTAFVGGINIHEECSGVDLQPRARYTKISKLAKPEWKQHGEYICSKEDMLSNKTNLSMETEAFVKNYKDIIMDKPSQEKKFFDITLKLKGPCCLDISSVFLDSLMSSCSPLKRESPPRPLPLENGVTVEIFSSNPLTNKNHIQDALSNLLYNASSRIYIMTPYFVPPKYLRKALENANYRSNIELLISGKSDLSPIPFDLLSQTYAVKRILIKYHAKKNKNRVSFMEVSKAFKNSTTRITTILKNIFKIYDKDSLKNRSPLNSIYFSDKNYTYDDQSKELSVDPKPYYFFTMPSNSYIFSKFFLPEFFNHAEPFVYYSDYKTESKNNKAKSTECENKLYNSLVAQGLFLYSYFAGQINKNLITLEMKNSIVLSNLAHKMYSIKGCFSRSLYDIVKCMDTDLNTTVNDTKSVYFLELSCQKLGSYFFNNVYKFNEYKLIKCYPKVRKSTIPRFNSFSKLNTNYKNSLLPFSLDWIRRSPQTMNIYSYPHQHMHAKMIIVEPDISWVGSFNWDRYSSRRNLEIMVQVEDKQFTTECKKVFNKRLCNSDEVHLTDPIFNFFSNKYFGRFSYSLLNLSSLSFWDGINSFSS